MKTKHTPGPWKFARFDDYGDARFYVVQADDASYTPDYSDVATLISETVKSERTAIQEANARLIAAAPDLLDALKMCLAYIETEDMRPLNLNKARAAIAKATGEK